MAGEVRSEADVWRLRAAAAEDAARELGGLAADLQRVLNHNHFGVGCVEGEVLFDRLVAIVSQCRGQFMMQSDELGVLKSRCLTAAAAYDEADAAGSQGM